MTKIKELFDILSSDGFKVIYLSHYDNVQLARLLARALEMNGFKVTVAEDARRFGKEFVSKKLEESDLCMVLNPLSDASALIIGIGGNIINIDIESLKNVVKRP